jgi:hypothetical protein
VVTEKRYAPEMKLWKKNQFGLGVPGVAVNEDFKLT